MVKAIRNDRYTYRVTWSEEDREHVGLCAEFPGLSWLAASPEAAFCVVGRPLRRPAIEIRRPRIVRAQAHQDLTTELLIVRIHVIVKSASA